MITAISARIVSKLVSSQLIEEDDTELFCYGLYIMLSNVMCFVEVVIFGLIFEILPENIVFYILFFPLRRYAGGVHAGKEITCIFCTTFAILLSSCGIKVMGYIGCYGVCLFCIIVGSWAIYLLSPLDTPEKPLDSEEYIFYRKKTIIFTFGINITSFLSYNLGMYGIFVASSVSIFLEGALLVLGKLKKQ